jgi:N-acyl-phosphatidylethanolamine-hydrolysing phospholipase D
MVQTTCQTTACFVMAVWYGDLVVRPPSVESTRGRFERGLALIVSCVLVLMVITGDASGREAQSTYAAPASHHLKSGFRNLDRNYSYSMLGRVGRLMTRVGQWSQPRGKPLTLAENDGGALRANGTDATATWIGHSTFLVQLDGVNILTDPHRSERASPLRLAGPRRMIAPGLRFEDLPPIQAVVISHDHYDHLDEETVRWIARTHHQAVFVVPLGLREFLADLGITRVVELDWWESTSVAGLTFVCTPAQHSSGRTLTDQNRRLWASWAILGTKRLFFAGDTGYFPELKDIGDRLGPFQLAAVPIGGYSSFPTRHPNHVNPEEAVQLFADVGGELLVPMHWATFDMNIEPFAEPPRRLLREAQRRALEERIKILAPGQTLHW